MNKNVQSRRKGRKEGRKNGNRKINSTAVFGKQLGQVNTAAQTTEVSSTIIRYIGKVTSDGVGQINTRFSLRNPLRAQDGGGTYNEIAEWAALYDEYKVTSFTVQFSPLSPVGITALGTLYSCVDFDSPDTPLVGGANEAVNYNNYRTWNPREQFEMWCKVPKIAGAETVVVGDPAVIHQGGWFDYQKPPINGNVYFTGENHPNSTAIGRVVLTMKIVNRRRR
jgi:hypothetical protein